MNPVMIAVTQGLAQYVEAGERDSRRLFHGRGGSYPGYEQVTVDLFDPVLLVTLYQAPPADLFEGLEQIAELRADPFCVLVQHRYQAGGPLQCLLGQMPDRAFARRGDLRFGLRLDQRQNCGYFLDMEPGRRWLEQRARGRNVLNLFAFTCAFSVVAQHVGARQVVNVDMSSSALARGRDNHRLNHLSTDSVRFLKENILKSWGRIRRPGPYDIAIVDPPSYQPGSFVARRDYARVLRRLPEFMAPGGEVLLCLNAPELGEDFLLQLAAEHCPAAEFVERLPPAEGFPDLDPDRRLKLMVFRMPPGKK